MRRPHLAAVLAFFLSAPVAAQEPLTEVVNVTAIQLSVDVRDRNGNVPPDLKPEDFVVVENGIERAVTAVEYERIDARLEGQTDAAPPATSAEKPDRNIVIYVDLELSHPQTVREAILGLSKEASRLTALGPVDVIVTNPEVRWIVRGATDAQALAEALQEVSRLHANDRLAAHRRAVLSDLQLRTRPAERMQMKLFEARAAIAAEEELVTRFHTRMTRVVHAVPRRGANVMFLVSDGFDLDPIDFYAEYLDQPSEIPHLRNAWSSTSARLHDEFSRSLATTGWTVAAMSGGIVADFADDASHSGAGKVPAFLSRNNQTASGVSVSAPGPGSSGAGSVGTMRHRRDALLAITDATGGSIASAAPEFAKTISMISSRVRITYQVPRAPDTKPRKIEVRVKREGVRAAASRWTSSSTPEVTAAARALEQLRGSGAGELPAAARIQLAANADRRNRASGSLEVRLGLEPLGAMRERLDRTTVRVSIAVESETAAANVMHQTIENYDLSKLQRILFTAPLHVDPKVRRIAVVMEELSSGMWGGTSIEIPASTRQTTFESANWEEAKNALAADGEPQESDGIAWMPWDDALTRAKAENKLIFIKIDFPAVCFGCEAPNPSVYRHPTFRRLLETSFVPVRVGRNEAKKLGLTRFAAIADPWGRIRYQWEFKTAVELGTRLSNVASYASSIISAGAKQNANPDDPDAQFTIGYAYLLTDKEPARDAYTKAHELAVKAGNDMVRERAETHLAILEARNGHRDKAVAELERIVAHAKLDGNAAEALLVLGHIRKADGDAVGAAEAFSQAAARAPKGSDLAVAALAQTGGDVAPVVLGRGGATLLKPIQLIRPRGAVIAGDVQLQTVVRDARVDEVRFFVDDRLMATDAKPPFTASVELEAQPRPHTFRIEAYGQDRKLLGQDTLRVNERHDELAAKIVTPRGGAVSGRTRVEVDVQRPTLATIARVELYWNETKIGTLPEPPFATEVMLPGNPGYIRAVAVMDDGRTAEDAVTLNTAGFAESIDVALAELYVRVTDGKDKPIATLTQNDFTVLDRNVPQEIVRVEYLDRPPLLLGVALDTSPSMKEQILDVHTTAQEFLRDAFASDARAFVIDFDEAPRLVQETTNDLDLLTQRIGSVRLQGRSTALFDALMFALLQFEGTSGKKALVIVSDGDDLSSRYTAREVADFAREAGVALYPIIFNAGLETLRPIAAMAKRSGGKVFSTRGTANLQSIYREISEELAGQYLVTIAPKSGGKRGEHRAVEVKVSAKHANVATPGYHVK
jgi:Ca-activated chloride channel family protein